jgi:nucleoside-diphosphate-sugar epimerase
MPAITTKTTTLVVGATGATGRHVVRMLQARGQNVRVVVRSKKRMLELLDGEIGDNLSITEASISDLSTSEIKALTAGCTAVVCCLGHTLNFKGIWGHPRKLVTDAVKVLTNSVEDEKIKFILMGSDGVANPNGQDDKRPFIDRMVLAMLRFLLPPVADNEDAAHYLHSLGRDTSVEWCVVRPDDLIDGEVSNYILLPKPKYGLFGPGKTTRSNVANSMVELILNEDEWQKWKFQMPVINDVIT